MAMLHKVGSERTGAEDLHKAHLDLEGPFQAARLRWPRMRKGLPLAGSLLFHGSVIAAGFLMYQTIQIHRQANADYVPATMNFGTMVSNDNVPVPVSLSGPGHDPSRPTWQNINPTASSASTGWQTHRGVSRSLMSAGGLNEQGPVIPIGIGPGEASGPIGIGVGPGNGSSAPFGPNPQIGGTPAGQTIFPTNPNKAASRYAYVCDASGSMNGKFDLLRMELRRSIAQKRPIDAFNVYFFSSGAPQTMGQGRLIPATPAHRGQAFTFLDGITPQGQTDPIPAIEAALKQKPQVLYLLTDGDFPDNQAVLRFIRLHNADHRTQIHTIAFFDEGADYQAVLKTIAQENGGLFRFVSEEDLRK